MPAPPLAAGYKCHLKSYSLLGDYALFLRASSLELAGRLAEARVVYDQLAGTYPASPRAKEARRSAAGILLKSGNASAVPLSLKDLAAANDAAALLMTAKAYEQSSDSARALGAYRRIYFYAPVSAESVEAAGAITRLGSTPSPATSDEAITRADKLYEARRFLDASQAYGEAFARFSTTATTLAQLRRVIAAANVRKTIDAVSALNAIPTSAERHVPKRFMTRRKPTRARASGNRLAVAWKSRGRSFPTSPFTPRALVSVGQIAEDANNQTDASYFLGTAVSSFQGSTEVAQAQFDLAWMAHEAKNYSESAKLLTGASRLLCGQKH